MAAIQDVCILRVAIILYLATILVLALGGHLGFGSYFNLRERLRRSWGEVILRCDIFVPSATRFKMSLKALGARMMLGRNRYINILTWLRGFQVKLLYLVLFSLYPSLFWELRDKRNLKNLQFLPESLGAMLEY